MIIPSVYLSNTYTVKPSKGFSGDLPCQRGWSGEGEESKIFGKDETIEIVPLNRVDPENDIEFRHGECVWNYIQNMSMK